MEKPILLVIKKENIIDQVKGDKIIFFNKAF